MFKEAVNLVPVGHSGRSRCLAGLGHALQSRFDRLGELGDLDLSKSLSSEAVRLSPVGMEKCYSLGILGFCLESRF